MLHRQIDPKVAGFLAGAIMGAIPLVAQDSEIAARLGKLPFTEGGTTLAVLPDTQYYSQKYPENFEARTKWIADHYLDRRIVYTLHLGDIVQSDAPGEWEIAKRCLGTLDGTS